MGEPERDEEQAGRSDGTLWAREWATVQELSELNQRYYHKQLSSLDSIAGLLHAGPPERQRRALQPQAEHPDYWRGFYSAGRSVYLAVRPLLHGEAPRG